MPRPQGDAGLSPAQRWCGIRPGAGERAVRSAHVHGHPLPDVVSVRRVGGDFEVGLANHGTVTVPAADLRRYRKFHARAMEQLFQVFGHVDAGGWKYRLFRAMCETAGRDAEGRP